MHNPDIEDVYTSYNLAEWMKLKVDIAMTEPMHTDAGDLPPWLDRAADGAWLIRVKAVPGASRDEIAGALGDRLKIRVAAPPEAGKANKAICKLLASTLGVKRHDIEILSGAASAQKCVRIARLPDDDPHLLIAKLR